jgi:cellulose synthase/poly-beta-1,6-N-acetylglucosamine synthase-like glycosyltransferase
MPPSRDMFFFTPKAHATFEERVAAEPVAEFELKLDEREGTERNAGWPRVSVVTAVHNGAAHLEETICSLLDQRYPNLEYIVVDDGSTDRTPEIIKKYEKHLAWRRQENAGMYAALNAGFAKSSGEILGWLNDSDKLHTGALLVVGSVFRSLPEVKWITGRPTWFNEEGMTVALGEPPIGRVIDFWQVPTAMYSKSRLSGGGVCGSERVGTWMLRGSTVTWQILSCGCDFSGTLNCIR